MLTGPRAQATILYRLEGVTVKIRFEPAKFGNKNRWFAVPADALPIPFTLTDIGRAYLAQLRSTESEAEPVTYVPRATELPRPRRAAGQRRWSRKTLLRLTREVPTGGLLVFSGTARQIQGLPLGAVASPAAR